MKTRRSDVSKKGDDSLVRPDKEWQAAREYAELLAPAVPVFADCIRIVRAHGHEPASGSSRAVALRLLECPSLMASFYFAGLAFFPDKLSTAVFVSEQQLLEIFTADEFAAILTVLILYRKARQFAPRKGFQKLTRSLQSALELGMLIGRSIPEIGSGLGMIAGGLRHLSQSIFMILDENTFGKYILRCRMEEIPYDLAFESRTWGCTHAHIGALLMLTLGYGAEQSYSFYLAITSRNHSSLDDDTTRIAVMTSWLDSLLITKEAPKSGLGDEYVISAESYKTLAGRIMKIVDKGSEHRWLSIRVRDLDPDQKLMLFGRPGDKATIDYLNLPRNVRDAFTLDEWKNLTNDVQRLLEE